MHAYRKDTILWQNKRQCPTPVAHAATDIKHGANLVQSEPLSHQLEEVPIPPEVPLVVEKDGRMDFVLDVIVQTQTF